MKKTFFIITFSILPTVCFANHYVKPHMTKQGRYVGGHYQTNSDRSKLNNWSTKGNINPYTGKKGYRNPY